MATFADQDSGFLFWAETSRPTDDATVSAQPLLRGVHRHPFAGVAGHLRRVCYDSLPSAEETLKRFAEPRTAIVWLPSTRSGPQASPGLPGRDGNTYGGALKLKPWQVDAVYAPASHVLTVLAAVPAEDDTTPGIRIGADLRFWNVAARLTLEILAGQRYTPTLVKEDKRYLALWQPMLTAADRERLNKLAQAMPPLCRALVRTADDQPETPHALLDNFVAILVNAYPRWHGSLGRQGSPYDHCTMAEAWLSALVGQDPMVTGNPSALDLFYEQYCAWAEPVRGIAGGDPFRVCFRLDPPSVPAEMDDIFAPLPTMQDWTLRYFLQAVDDPSLLISARDIWQQRDDTASILGHTLVAPQERLLTGLAQAGRVFPLIEASLRAARPEQCQMNAEEAYHFMQETALLLQAGGFGVLVPNLARRVGVKIRLRPRRQPTPKGTVGRLSLESIIEYDWQLAVGDQTLSPEEFERLASLKVPLVRVRGQWVELQPDQMQRLLRDWKKQQAGGELSLQDALRLALGTERAAGPSGLPVHEVVADGWLDDLFNHLKAGQKVACVPVPAAFRGILRPYQVVGLSWLAFLRQWGLGGCLADDMGLGKTIQIIALLLHERSHDEQRPALLICPTSIVGNWRRELARFAPDLRVLTFHGPQRKKINLAEEAMHYDVVISSYALLHRSEAALTAVPWGDVILDEAQNIKNPGTKQAQAARKLPAAWRVALTGTPVENRLSELWSIFNFINPGYLGSQESFRQRLALPIERVGDATATKTLKSLVGPFILRRVKTDPTVISDLPQKNEIKVYCTLTREQATLYEAVVRDSMEHIAKADGFERRGLVLAMMLKLKQVCNHPAHFLGDGSALANRSGKLNRLGEMLEEVRSVHERALVFTQFAEMGALLKSYLQEVLADDVLFLHGGTPSKARDAMVDRFQNDPNGPTVFILSIKAGGIGLNLMRANHVFHFDRWWNPAVENQATDRAFRIGQTKNVQVYKYICSGTFEEEIDDLIESKKVLAESIVGAGEAWITEMSTEQLRDIFRLRRDAVADD